jgi:hypothetical protein
MRVSMDGLRWQLLNNYNSLTRKLNRSIKKYETFDDEITLSPEDIQKEMDDIRSCIVTLAYMYDNREDGFKILEDPHFESFNEIEEEDLD